MVEGINGPSRENAAFLPGHAVPESVAATHDLAAVFDASEVILMVVPTNFVASTLGTAPFAVATAAAAAA